MKRTSGVTKRVETWTQNKGKASETTVVKIAVRHTDGTFHGSTNFKQK